MRRSILLSSLAGALALFGGVGTASAQAVDVDVYSGPAASSYNRYRDPGYGYRGPVYGYTSTDDDDDQTVVVRRTYRGNCGTYHYWDGTACVDARVVPPDND